MEREPLRTLQVEFVDEPSLWGWEIHDCATRRAVRSSWKDEWMGYRTREEACAAGLTRLDEMLGRSDEAGLIERLEQCQLEHTTRQILGSAG